MKKIIVLILVIGLLLSTATVSMGGREAIDGTLYDVVMLEKTTLLTFYGNTLYVGGSGTGNYSSIQDAIDNASDGDTVFVFDDSSPYYENIVINVNIDLIGEDRYTTIIDGGGADYVLVIDSPGIRITGFTVRNAGGLQGTGIRVNSDNNEIHGNILTANKCYGLYVASSSYNTIFDNIVSENDDWAFGIWLGSSSHNLIHDCEIMDNSMGIVLDRSSYNNISRNNITSNSRGIDLYYSSSHNEIFENFIDGNHWGVGLYSNYGSTCYNVVKRNIVSNGIGGIELEGKASGELSYNIVTANNVTNNEGGIMLRYYTSNNEIYHNNLIDNINSWTDEPNNAFDYGVDNFWYNITLEEGNYWDDYKEKYPYARPRLLRPWIWNIPYKVKGDGCSKDRFPLVKEYNGSFSINIQQLQSISQKSDSNQQQSCQSQQSSQQSIKPLLFQILHRLQQNI